MGTFPIERERERGCSSAVKRWTATQKVTGSIPVRGENPCGWKTLSVHPAVNGYLIQFREGLKGSGRRGMGSAFHVLCPRHGDSLQVTAATAY